MNSPESQAGKHRPLVRSCYLDEMEALKLTVAVKTVSIMATRGDQ